MAIYMRFPQGKPKTLTFSYDDGVDQDKRLIKILDSHKMKGTFNLNSGAFAPEGTVYPEGTTHRRMTKSECEKLYVNHEVALHGLTHPWLEQITPAQCTYEVLTDRINLERMTGKITRGMAYPFGTYSDSVVETLKACGIVYSRTVISSEKFDMPTDWLRLAATCHHNSPRLMELAKQFAERDTSQGTPMMFYLWGHAYEFDANNNWNVIEEFTDYMADRDDIWYATNIEIYDYTKAFEQLIFDIDETMCTNPTASEIWFMKGGKVYSVNGGETIRI